MGDGEKRLSSAISVAEDLVSEVPEAEPVAGGTTMGLWTLAQVDDDGGEERRSSLPSGLP